MGSEFMPAKLRWKFFYLIKSCFIRYFGCYPIMFRSNFKPILDILGTNLVQIRAFYVLRSAWKHKTKINFLAFVISNIPAVHAIFVYFDLYGKGNMGSKFMQPSCSTGQDHESAFYPSKTVCLILRIFYKFNHKSSRPDLIRFWTCAKWQIIIFSWKILGTVYI